MTGLRFNAAELKRRFAAKKKAVNAAAFMPELRKFTTKVLAECVRTTPKRSANLIKPAQRREYHKRVNYVPSVHSMGDPSLIVSEGKHWLLCGGKWYLANEWHLEPHIFAAYSMLLNEHFRRASTPRDAFVNEREQASNLYRRSWWQAAQSLGLTVAVGAAIIASHTRRKPAKAPPKGYGIWRGGLHVISVIVRNPMCDANSRWKTFTAASIYNPAVAKYRPAYERECAKKAAMLLSTK